MNMDWIIVEGLFVAVIITGLITAFLVTGGQLIFYAYAEWDEFRAKKFFNRSADTYYIFKTQELFEEYTTIEQRQSYPSREDFLMSFDGFGYSSIVIEDNMVRVARLIRPTDDIIFYSQRFKLPVSKVRSVLMAIPIQPYTPPVGEITEGCLVVDKNDAIFEVQRHTIPHTYTLDPLSSAGERHFVHKNDLKNYKLEA